MLVWWDLAAGASLLAVAGAAVPRSRRYAVVALVAALAWFAGDLGGQLLLLHRPLLLHAALAYPDGRVSSRYGRALIAAAWAATLAPQWSSRPVTALVLAGLVAVEAARGRARDTGSRATALVALSLAGPAAVRVWWPALVPPDALIAGYCGLVLAVAAVLLVGLLPRSTGLEADAVIELSDGTPGETLVQLRRTAAASGDPARRAALESAAALLASNAALHEDLAGKVLEVRASRDRLVEAAATEQRRLERLLREGAVSYLAELDGVLRQFRECADGPARELAGQCLDEVDRTRDDLDQLARGLHPRTLAEHGLAAALVELADRSPVPTSVRAPQDRLPAPVEAALWYACAEALANVAKHAQAGAASVDVCADSGEAVATIRDDGRGGARVTPAGGLAGLVDRLAGAGGQVAVGPAPGGGTAVQVRIPLP
jgi:signal transduction histidine kinase